MASYAPPSGPPPPRVPDGWKAVFNEQYQEWFYVNLTTKQSQWELPTEPAYAAPGDGPPPGAPPSYDPATGKDTGPEKSSNNPFMNQSGQSSAQMTEDERLARQMQEEEDARAKSRGTSDGYYNQGQQSYAQNASQLPPREEKKKGLLGKLSSKLGGSSSSSSRPAYGYPQQQYGGYPQNYPPQQPYGYGQPYGAPGYGGHPGYGPPPGAYYGGYPPRRQGGGMGAGGGAALGLGAGLLGGALIAESFDDDGGGDDGGGDGGDGGGDG